jgi:hypothetical protein
MLSTGVLLALNATYGKLIFRGFLLSILSGALDEVRTVGATRVLTKMAFLGLTGLRFAYFKRYSRVVGRDCEERTREDV